MKVQMAVFITSLALLAVAFPVQAHHPFTAQFDPDKPLKVTGTVTKVDWTNPHAHIAIDVKDANGQTTNWEFELGGLTKLKELKWKKDTVKVGDQITVSGWKARDGSNHASADVITLANGLQLAAGSSYFDRNKQKTPTSN